MVVLVKVANEGNNTLDIFVPSGSYVLGETHNYIISSSITGSFSEGKTIYTSFNTRMSHSLQGGTNRTVPNQFVSLWYEWNKLIICSRW